METEKSSLATMVIQKLIRIIIILIVFIFINNGVWIWYISLPTEETSYTQEADTDGDNSPINQNQ